MRSITVRNRGTGCSRGSGVVWHSDGLIVTNAHVAQGRIYSVEFGNGQQILAQTVARDAAVDLAALKVNLSDLPAAIARSAREVRPGELVIATGNPWDGDGAVSTGIVHHPTGQVACIFANIHIFPGNSGGPLADANGQVIGINNAMIRGLACAVISDAVRDFLRKETLEAA